MICTFVQIKMVRPTDNDDATPRKANLREAILCAAEDLFSTNGFNAVSVRDIAQAAGANPGSVTYHFKTKDGLLLEIYRRHCGTMNRRRAVPRSGGSLVGERKRARLQDYRATLRRHQPCLYQRDPRKPAAYFAHG